jgi:hypothetical protein
LRLYPQPGRTDKHKEFRNLQGISDRRIDLEKRANSLGDAPDFFSGADQVQLSLQQGMRTFPPCAFSTSMLSGGPPIFEWGPPQQPIVVRLRSESFQSDGIIVRTSHQLTFAKWGNSGIVPYEVVIRCFGA